MARWEQSLFQTTVLGPIDPQPDWQSFGAHRVFHPWIGLPERFHSAHMEFASPPALPVGAVDPVSGVAAFDPLWRDGLKLHFTLGNYWVVENYDQAATRGPPQARPRPPRPSRPRAS